MKAKDYISPELKTFIKSLLYFFKRFVTRRKRIVTKYDYKEFYTTKADTFFGYYDISPFNNNEEFIYLRLRKGRSTIEILKNNFEENKESVIAFSHAWNWQQGCRLRWINDNVISFNDFDGYRYINRIINLKTNDERICPWPLYDIDLNNKLGLTLDFERLGRLRPGYGYTCKGTDKMIDSDNCYAIAVVDVSQCSIIKRIPYKDIFSLFPSSISIDNCYVNHLSFSPKGDRFLFFWIEIISGYHKASLTVYDIKEEKIVLLEVDGKASHYVWLNNDEILCTVYSSPTKCRYYVYNIIDKTKVPYCPNCLLLDGHPSMYNEQQILTDTYPDSDGYQYLRMANSESDTYFNMAEIYSVPVAIGEKRTDLHPRFNHNKSRIAFDANTRGHRSFIVLDYKSFKKI